MAIVKVRRFRVSTFSIDNYSFSVDNNSRLCPNGADDITLISPKPTRLGILSRARLTMPTDRPIAKSPLGMCHRYHSTTKLPDAVLRNNADSYVVSEKGIDSTSRQTRAPHTRKRWPEVFCFCSMMSVTTVQRTAHAHRCRMRGGEQPPS